MDFDAIVDAIAHWIESICPKRLSQSCRYCIYQGENHVG